MSIVVCWLLPGSKSVFITFQCLVSRRFLVITISSFACCTVGDIEKPAVWFDGGIHAREWISPASVMYFTNQVPFRGRCPRKSWVVLVYCSRIVAYLITCVAVYHEFDVKSFALQPSMDIHAFTVDGNASCIREHWVTLLQNGVVSMYLILSNFFPLLPIVCTNISTLMST